MEVGMYFYYEKDRLPKELVPGIMARTFWGQNLMLAVVNLEANATLPLHRHPHEQGGIVLEGELTFNIGGEVILAHPGDLYIIPGDVSHSVKVGSQPAKVMDIFSPVREEYKFPNQPG
jgi:quercetin dioxygenase-like cupin family protein